MKQLRPYQQEAYDAVFKALDRGCQKMMVVLPTGCGKSLNAVRIAGKFNKILWMTHTEELIAQSGAALLQEFYPEIDINVINNKHGNLIEYQRFLLKYGAEEEKSKFGLIKADLFNIDAHITLASFQTLHRRLDRIPADLFDLVIIDECHHATSVTTVKSLTYFKPQLLLGLTATATRADGMQLGDVFDEIVYQYPLGEAIKDGWLVEIEAVMVKTKLNLDNVRTTAGELNQKDLKETVDTPERNKLIVDKYKELSDGLQCVVFCVDVEHAQNVCAEFVSLGYKAEFIVGDEELTPDRIDVIKRFKKGQTTILVNVMILTEGFDYPGIMTVIMACPTKSATKFFQQLGRGTRTLPGVIDGIDLAAGRIHAIKKSAKKKLILIDIVDTTTRHRLVNTYELDKEARLEDRVFLTSERREELIASRNKRKLNAQREKEERLNIFTIPRVKMSTSIKMVGDATEKQLETLKRNGYNVEVNHYTKAMASKIISDLPCFDNYKRFLGWKIKELGMKINQEDLSKMTYGEFTLAKEKLERLQKQKAHDNN